MRRLIPVVLCSIALCAQAGGLIRLPSTEAVDLDKPGALEALQRDNPKHYDAVMKRVDAFQTVPLADQGMRNLGLFVEPLLDWEGGSDLRLSSPAQARIRVMVESMVYVITVHVTKDPAHLVPAAR